MHAAVSRSARAETFEDLRPLLFSIAYRMLGSVSRGRGHRPGGVPALPPRAGRAGRRDRVAQGLPVGGGDAARDRPPALGPRPRARVIGEWLPEPLLTDERARRDAAEHAEDADSLSMAFLLVLERLSPVERAVFLLHDVFDYGYDEVAADRRQDARTTAGSSPSRARRHVDEQQAAVRGVAASSASGSPQRFFAAVERR